MTLNPSFSHAVIGLAAALSATTLVGCGQTSTSAQTQRHVSVTPVPSRPTTAQRGPIALVPSLGTVIVTTDAAAPTRSPVDEALQLPPASPGSSAPSRTVTSRPKQCLTVARITGDEHGGRFCLRVGQSIPIDLVNATHLRWSVITNSNRAAIQLRFSCDDLGCTGSLTGRAVGTSTFIASTERGSHGPGRPFSDDLIVS